VPESGGVADEIRTWCRGRLADHKLPKRVVVLGDLPRTAGGKLIRHRETLRRATNVVAG
jgi:acyl-CoA synthetase (AMP-forming)/AMP-acid ligase II